MGLLLDVDFSVIGRLYTGYGDLAVWESADRLPTRENKKPPITILNIKNGNWLAFEPL